MVIGGFLKEKREEWERRHEKLTPDHSKSEKEPVHRYDHSGDRAPKTFQDSPPGVAIPHLPEDKEK